jgi:hypothetical protein
VKLQLARIWQLGMVALVLGGVAFLVAGNRAEANDPVAPLSNHCACRHNAQQKKEIVNYGASALIQWKKLNLNNGQYSYHRVATIQASPWRYVEFGWWKNSLGLCGGTNTCAYIVYNAGGLNYSIAILMTRADHTYAFQYNPNDGEYWFYLDGAYVWHQDANFLSGTRVAAGGEVGLGVEQMKDVHISNLLYSKNNAGVFSYQYWNGYVDYQQEAPYSNTDGGPNDFFDHGP